MTDEQNQGGMTKLKAVLGFGLVIISGAFALTMVMRFVGRFLVFLVVDRPEIGFGFLLSTLATTALGLYIAWQVGKKGYELSGGGGPEVIIDEGVRNHSTGQRENQERQDQEIQGRGNQAKARQDIDQNREARDNNAPQAPKGPTSPGRE